ncbi:cell envelope integrity protein CreD [Arenimonas fontis]|nr:cell envelope integrity protein CreD [Arenimonas fontis]
MRIGWKLVLVGGLMIVLLVPLALLDGLVAERQQRGREVAMEIARASAGNQRVVGPLLVIEAERWRRGVRRRAPAAWDGGDGARAPDAAGTDAAAWHWDEGATELVVVAPERIDLDGQLRVERRGRSLFSVPLFHAALKMEAELVPALPRLPDLQLRPRRAWLVLGLGDNRGLRGQRLRLDGRELPPAAGTPLAWLPEGFQAEIDPARLEQPMRIAVEMDLVGTGTLEVLPSGGETTVALRGDWPHPGFAGQYLPLESALDGQGFRARWALSGLSSRVPSALAACAATRPDCEALQGGGIGLRLVEPVDRYLMTERAMKYALLFLALVFGAVFLVEALAARPVHAVQYGLTGLALAMFYLLLLSLSEHIGFGTAYAIAALACSGLLGYYLAAVLGGAGRGWGFGAGLAALYGLLYALLRSEDHALLVGSGLLFAALATVMALTRRVDWYRLGER